MSRDYKNYKQVKKKSVPLPVYISNGLSFCTGLALGIFIALIVYFKEHNATIKINKAVATANQSTTTAEPIPVQQDNQTTLPEPEFDFYKILPNKKFDISEWESSEDENEHKIADQQAIFVLQVGSFKQFDDADEIKAKLALIGITADIQRVVINGHDVRHRVRVGPYSNQNSLRAARGRLLENELDFMELKLKLPSEDTVTD